MIVLSKINVEKIAETISKELNDKYVEDIKTLVVDSVHNEYGSNTEKEAALLHGISQSLKNHIERFTITLVQEVVDQLEDSKS